ncbi:MAG TPA: methyltransferase domain-containing protein [Terriglobales bacterium]|nr:methyltransferase domain-containing protein [Terriglobales bacterium]
MPEVDLYNSSYGNYALDVYREVRLETYGEDFGQTSWVTIEESQEIPRLLGIEPGTFVLEIGCGSGGYALHLVETRDCHIVGLDLNHEGIHTANGLAKQKSLTALASFRECDVSQTLPFADETFHAVLANDVLCHIPRRLSLLSEIRRVLKTGGRMLFSDALVIGGMVSKEELGIRSSIGPYFFLPAGENEKLIEGAGFQLLESRDTTEQAASIAGRWRDARKKRKAALESIEGEANFSGLQRFLNCVHTLTSERRLLRHLYIARK